MLVNNTEIPKYRFWILALSLVINIIYFMILQLSSHTIWQLTSLKVIYALINVGLLFAFVGILYACTDKLWVAEAIFGSLCTAYAIINIYVVEFHGTPLTIPEFVNTRTALNVLKGYSFIEMKPLIFLTAICVLSFVNLFFINRLKKFETCLLDGSRQKSIVGYWWHKSIIFLAGCVYIIGILHVECLIEPVWQEWLFKEAIGKYGYPLYFLASGLEYEISLPLDYSEENVASISIENYIDNKENDIQNPDIILILNETFYDISLVTDIETDVDYMGAFYNMDNSISGHAIVPKIGGGTNNSEYELLTANSTYLMQGITPFQALDMTKASSIITNLKELNYYTIAMHPSYPENYARNKAYLNMGFDEIYFLDDFENKEYYASRDHVTDKSSFENMIRWYENALQKQKPIFSYLLTIQNHGEWNTNPPSDDIVHIINYDNKAYEEKLNEYLSCISLSSKELENLIEYLEKSDRPVVLCMVGDHAPSFIEEISDDNKNNAILQRATPFIIWANFPIDEKKDVIISMNELGLLLLDTAGVRMFPYYKYLSNLGKDVPVLTSYGDYIDKDGNIYSYTDEGRYSKRIQKYFWMEYNNLQKTSLDRWFSLQTVEN